MDRRASVDQLMTSLANGSVSGLRRAERSEATAFGAVQASVAAFWVGEFAEASALADLAIARAADPTDRACSVAARALARSGDLMAAGIDPFPELHRLLARTPDNTVDGVFTHYLATEAALCSARISEAIQFSAGGIDPAGLLVDHPFGVVVQACAVRTATFVGQVAEAEALLVQMRASAVGRLVPLVGAIEALVSGNADEAGRTRAWVAEEQNAAVLPDDFIARGRLLLLAYGAVAIGDVSSAATLVLRAGGDAGLRRMTIVDRALGLELLVVAALADGDDEATSAWAAEAEVLMAHPISAPTIGRLRARVALAAGDRAEAIRLAERSVAACRRDGRLVEAAESELVLARARIESGDVREASRRLRSLVMQSDHAGHRAVRREAGRTLGSARRRLPPVVGGGWQVLSARETEIGEMILAGYDTGQIAGRLNLSAHTVRVHTSRVLAAFGVASRVALLALEGARGQTGVPDMPLTPRQREVVRLMSAGQTNEQIAQVLGISVRTVEKHLADALVRWNVRTRFELARQWLLGAA